MGSVQSSRVRILVADDHALFREGVHRLLEAERGLLVVGEAADGVEALRLTSHLEPDIILLDWTMPRMSGIGVLRALASNAASARVIILPDGFDKGDLRTALELGARGVVLKDVGSAVLVKAIRAVMAGRYWVGHESAASREDVLRGLSRATRTAQPHAHLGLTPREVQIVCAVATACTNKEMAKQFAISEKTVKHHLTNIFEKLGVSNRLELAIFAIEHRLVLPAERSPH